MTQTIASHPAYPRQRAVAPVVRVAEATKLQFYWMCALILSFAYELPVFQLTGMDRANPRLFDLVAAFGVVILLFQNHNFRRPINNPIFKWWARLVIWFAICAGIWAAFWYPWDVAGKFSVYYAFKYLEGLLCIFLVAVIPVSSRQKHILHLMVVVGGVIVGTYAVFERLQGSTVRYIAEGKEIRRAEGVLFSCLGPTYFHLASFTATAAAMSFAMVNKCKSTGTRLLFYAAAGIAAWPAAFSGSRTGLGMLLIVLACVFLFMRRTRVTMAIAVAFCLLAIFQLMSSEEFIQRATDTSASVRRLFEYESRVTGRNSMTARVGLGLQAISGFTGESYTWQGGRLPLFGGGFYAVPQSSMGQIVKYRVGYGIHNAYLFPYEQAGILGIILFGIFLFVTVKYVWRALSFQDETDKQFAIGVWCALMAFIPAMWVGQVFWRGFGTENFNTLLIILFVLAIRGTADRPVRLSHQRAVRPQHQAFQPTPYRQ